MMSMMGTSKAMSGKPMTPLSPLGSSMPTSQYGMTSPSRLMPPPSRFAPRPARSYAPSFPMATPLTNPGLSTPHPPSSGGSGLLPLADYRPTSLSSLGASVRGSAYPPYDEGGDLRRYTAIPPAPIGNRSPSPPSQSSSSMQYNPPSP